MRLTLNLAFLLLTRQLLAQGVPRRTECLQRDEVSAQAVALGIAGGSMPALVLGLTDGLQYEWNDTTVGGAIPPLPAASLPGQGNRGRTLMSTQPELLREVREGLVGSPPHLRRGPLQLILELEWSQALSRKRGSVR